MTPHPDLAVLTRLGPTIVIAGRLDNRTCSCPHGPACDHPGSHPLDERWWWATATRDTATLAAQLGTAPHAWPAILLEHGVGVLQVPGSLQLILRNWLDDRLDPPPPIVHSPARSFVWLASSAPLRHQRTLPPPHQLTVIGPGSWAPAPLPSGLRGDAASGLRWVGQPDAAPLTSQAADSLVKRLLQARKSAPTQDTR